MQNTTANRGSWSIGGKAVKLTRGTLFLKHGLYWKYRYPGPWDYKQETRFVGALLLIALMLYLLASSMEFEALRQQEREERETYQKMVMDCLNQATGVYDRVAWIIDDKIFNVQCQDWGSTEGIKRKI